MSQVKFGRGWHQHLHRNKTTLVTQNYCCASQMKQSKPNPACSVPPEPFEKARFGVFGRVASGYWTKLMAAHENGWEPFDPLADGETIFIPPYFSHDPQVLLAGWTTWFDVNISAQNSILHPQLDDYFKVGRRGVNFPGLKQWELKDRS